MQDKIWNIEVYNLVKKYTKLIFNYLDKLIEKKYDKSIVNVLEDKIEVISTKENEHTVATFIPIEDNIYEVSIISTLKGYKAHQVFLQEATFISKKYCDNEGNIVNLNKGKAKTKANK